MLFQTGEETCWLLGPQLFEAEAREEKSRVRKVLYTLTAPEVPWEPLQPPWPPATSPDTISSMVPLEVE